MFCSVSSPEMVRADVQEVPEPPIVVASPSIVQLRLVTVSLMVMVSVSVSPLLARALVLLLGTGGREMSAGVVEFRQAGGLVPVGWAENTVSLGLRPKVEVSRWPEVIEPVKAEVPRRLPAVPSAASGRLIAAGESDSWRVPVKQGEKLRFEVFADRLGSPLE